MRFECRVSGATTDAMAGAAVFRTLSRPKLIIVESALVLVLIVTIGTIAQSYAVGGVVGAVVGAIASWISAARLRRQFVRLVESGGYRPGALVAAEWDDEGFTVITPTSSTRHQFADVGRARRTDHVVTMLIVHTGQLLVIPAALAPADCTERFTRQS